MAVSFENSYSHACYSRAAICRAADMPTHGARSRALALDSVPMFGRRRGVAELDDGRIEFSAPDISCIARSRRPKWTICFVVFCPLFSRRRRRFLDPTILAYAKEARPDHRRSMACRRRITYTAAWSILPVVRQGWLIHSGRFGRSPHRHVPELRALLVRGDRTCCGGPRK
jgi:hypothetical protein